jgi:transposase-like protein
MDTKSKKRYDESEKQKWVERYQQVKTLEKVASEFNIAPMTVRGALIKAGIERNIRPRYSRDEKNAWIRLFNTGKSLGEISRERKVSIETIRIFLRKSGYQTKTIRRYTNQEKEKWVETYFECRNVSQVSDEFNVPLSTIHLHLTQIGVDIRKYSEEEIYQWIKAYQELKNTHKVAQKFGLHKGTVYAKLKERGLIEIPETVSEKWGDEIIRLYDEELYSIEEISKHLQLPYSTVGKHISIYSKTVRGRPRLTKDHHFFDNINSEKKAYWLGLIVADGYVHRSGIKIYASRQDRGHIKKLADILGVYIQDFERRTPKGNISKMSALEFRSTNTAEVLSSMGLSHDKAHDPQLAMVFEAISPELLNHFVRGVFDGDGHLTVFFDRGYKRVTLGFTGNTKFIERLRDCIVDKTKVRSNKVVRIKKSQFSAALHWGSKEDVYAILNWMYDQATITLPRKYEKAKNVLKETCTF